MADLFDYLHWRGDLPFSQNPPNNVDALIFSALAYIRFGGMVEEHPDLPVNLRDAAAFFFTLPDQEDRIRVKNDLNLLKAAAKTRRFGEAQLSHYQDLLLPEQETQFAAVTFLLNDGSAFLAFRGTDYSLVGWKEDFNMSFWETVPSQCLALEYTRAVASKCLLPLRMCGHSKGGNIAIYAAIKAEEEIQKRILAVYNNDGPGFREQIMQDPSYKEMVPRLHTFVPQSSVIGMLLEHEEPYIIIKSKQLGLLQHEIYSWELDGPCFVPMEEISTNSHFLNLTIKNWMAELTQQERNEVVDTLYDFLTIGNVESAKQILHPKNIRNYFKTLTGDDNLRKLLSGEFMNFIEAAIKTQSQMNKSDRLALESPDGSSPWPDDE